MVCVYNIDFTSNSSISSILLSNDHPSPHSPSLLSTLQKRSEIIATYALCGFANLSSIGIQLGGIGAMAPTRVADLSQLILRALFAGTVTTLMTASLAGNMISSNIR